MQLKSFWENFIHDYHKHALNCPQSECLEAVRHWHLSVANQNNDEMQPGSWGVDGHSWLSVQGLAIDKYNKCRDGYSIVASKRATHPQLVKNLVDQMVPTQ